MSKASKCDRCGKFYEYYKDILSPNNGRKFDCNGIAILKLNSNHLVSSTNIIDVCPECLTDFMKWFSFPNAQKPKKDETEVCTYEDIYREFLAKKWNNQENEILDWRPAEDVCSIRIWTKAGPIYIYDYSNGKLTLEVQHHVAE